jgi:hypothetical protein
MSTTAVLMGIAKPSAQHGTMAYYINCQNYNFYKSQTCLILVPFVNDRKFKALAGGESFMPRKIATGTYEDFVHYLLLYILYTADASLSKLQGLQNAVLRATGNLRDAHQSANCSWLSKFLTCMII